MTKQTLILLSGLLSDDEIWQHQIKHLNHIVNIMVIDWANVAHLDEAVQIVINKAPKTFYLAGHSQGGVIAMEIARKYPNRVLQLCLLNTSADPDTREKKALRQEMINMVLKYNFINLVDKCVMGMVHIESIKPVIRNMFLRNRSILANQQFIMLERPNYLKLLNQIQCPTLVVNSDQDKWLLQDHSRRLESGIPNCKVLTIRNSGHMLTMETPEAVSQLMLNWLAGGLSF